MSALATAEPWDLVAVNYAAESLPYFEAFSRAALRLAALPPKARVADIAAGPGTLSLLAAAEGATVSAIDLSADMVGEFRVARSPPPACLTRSTCASATASSSRSRRRRSTPRSRCSA